MGEACDVHGLAMTNAGLVLPCTLSSFPTDVMMIVEGDSEESRKGVGK